MRISKGCAVTGQVGKTVWIFAAHIAHRWTPPGKGKQADRGPHGGEQYRGRWKKGQDMAGMEENSREGGGRKEWRRTVEREMEGRNGGEQ